MKFNTTKNYSHVCLGNVSFTNQCLQLQKRNNDSTSIFMEHKGEIKELSRSCIKEA